MTGGAGAGTIAPTQLSQYGQWPPASFGDAVGERVRNLPSLVPTGTPITLAVPTPTPTGVDVGDGWANPSDTAGWYATKAGCNYLNPYSGVGAAVSTAPC
jgi:glucan 1,3-beta-glucosidase